MADPLPGTVYNVALAVSVTVLPHHHGLAND
jgi:hypothetical protein